MLVNTNNHALDGGPATSEMEKEVVADLAAMFGLPEEALGHLTASGTIANLEALWVARELHPGKAIAYSEEAHYTHSRMCGVLGIEGRAVAADRAGRIDLDALEEALRGGGIGTVVLTPGTTGIGAVDRIDQALDLRERYGVRLHVDAAYGGFFTLLAGTGLVPARAVPRDRGVRLGRRRPAQARPAALRLRRGAVPRPGRRAGCTSTTRPTRTSPPRSCTSARSASSARAPALPRRRCG